MGSFDSSPNYKSRFDGNKGNSPEGGSECDDMMSVGCSTCESSINGPTYGEKLRNEIKQRSSNNKTLRNFGKARSFRRRLRPTVVQSSVPFSDEDSLVESSHSSSPHYLQPTTSSQGKKTMSPHHSESPSSERSCSHPKSFQALSRKSSFRILIRKASFRPKRSTLDYPKVSVDRPTYSSTVKDSKFPEPVELESETSSGVKVCRYHHCSLHGCHGGHDPNPPLKRFLYKKRRSLKKQKSIRPRTESRRGAKSSKSRIPPIEEPLNQENVEDSHEEKLLNLESQPFGDGYKDIEEAILVEVAFGETSFPERSYRENLDILRKYSLSDQDFRGQSSCSCHNRDEVVSIPSRAEVEVPLHNATSFSPDEFSNEVPLLGSTNVSVTSSLSLFKNPNEASGLIWPETTAVSDEIAEKKGVVSSASYSQTSSDGNSEEEIESRDESTTTGDSKVDEVLKVEGSEVNSPVLTGSTLQFSKPRHISMWHMIHQHMSSNLSVEPTNQPVRGADGVNSPLAKESTADSDVNGMDSDSETQEIEIRKLFAIKLVREAIEKILLPQVQDQTSDDQSVASESSPRPQIIENNRSREVDAEGGEANLSSNPKEESATTDDVSSGKIIVTEKEVVRKTEKKAPKHWSNLKKWILLQRFIRELEKVRKFNPRKPRHLPLNPDPETEKVNLRPQTQDGRKNAEEWMLDYALRQAVSQLAPTQKRKVSLLVKAFETVVPQQDDSQVQARTPRPRVDSLDVPVLGSTDQETGIKMTNESKKVCDQDKPADCIEGKTKGSSQMDRKNHIKMWHMIYHHVVSGIAEKVGRQLLDGPEDDEAEQNEDSDDFSNNLRGGLTKSNALKLVKEAVDEILVPDIQDDMPDTQSVTSEGGNLSSKEGEDTKGESQVIKNWSKLKKLLLLKRSIRALEKARISKPQPSQLVPQSPDPEPEKVDLRRQIMDERKKAEQWMLDYAVQHIVTKLTPARKRRVSMLVEAFEAVVPIPER